MLHHIQGVGLPNVYLKNGFSVEGTGRAQTVAYSNLDALYVAIARSIAYRGAPLTAAEFRFLRRRLGMSQAEAGAIVGKSNQAIAKWEKESAPVPIADGKLLRLAWLARFARRELARAVDRMVRDGDYPTGDYVFAFDGSKWVDDAVRSVFLPLAVSAITEAEDLIGRVRSSSSAYTSSKNGAAQTIRIVAQPERKWTT